MLPKPEYWNLLSYSLKKKSSSSFRLQLKTCLLNASPNEVRCLQLLHSSQSSFQYEHSFVNLIAN